MSIEGGRNNLYWWSKSPPLSTKDKLGCLGIVVNIAIGIAALWWVFS